MRTWFHANLSIFKGSWNATSHILPQDRHRKVFGRDTGLQVPLNPSILPEPHARRNPCAHDHAGGRDTCGTACAPPGHSLPTYLPTFPYIYIYINIYNYIIIYIYNYMYIMIMIIISWWIIMIHHDESWFIMMNHDDSPWYDDHDHDVHIIIYIYNYIIIYIYIYIYIWKGR